MSNIIIPKGWHIPERDVTPEETYNNRREFLKALGLGAMGIGLLGCSSPKQEQVKTASSAMMDTIPSPNDDLYPAQRNVRYKVDRPMTDEKLTQTYNNFYEFSEDKEEVSRLVEDFQTRPWELEITGMVQTPVKLTIDELVRKLPLEERAYRFRCVEAWAMTVPWTGISLKKILELAQPLRSATHVRFVSFFKPAQATNQQRATWYNWPYYEGLRIEEAMNELTMGVTGIYGHELPKQSGAPFRVIVPWKYGYKGPKSVVKIELTDQQPKTFWNDLNPDEYSFESNVNPGVPHPRWSQATERLLGNNSRVDTTLYNGYGEYVAKLYS